MHGSTIPYDNIDDETLMPRPPPKEKPEEKDQNEDKDQNKDKDQS